MANWRFALTMVCGIPLLNVCNLNYIITGFHNRSQFQICVSKFSWIERGLYAITFAEEFGKDIFLIGKHCGKLNCLLSFLFWKNILIFFFNMFTNVKSWFDYDTPPAMKTWCLGNVLLKEHIFQTQGKLKWVLSRLINCKRANRFSCLSVLLF